MVLSSANSVTHPYKSKDKLAGTIVTMSPFKFSKRNRYKAVGIFAASPRMHHTDDAHRDRHAPAPVTAVTHWHASCVTHGPGVTVTTGPG